MHELLVFEMDVRSHILEPEIVELSGIVAKFIETKRIDPAGFEKFKEAIKSAEAKREYWALNEQIAPTQSVTVYGAYKVIYLSLSNILKTLQIGYQKKENPISAEKVMPVFEFLINLTRDVSVVDGMVRSRRMVSDTQIESVYRSTALLYSKTREIGIAPVLQDEIKGSNSGRSLKSLGDDLYVKLARS